MTMLMGVEAPNSRRTTQPERTRPPRSSGERLAVGLGTAAMVFQPMLRPAGPGNSSPVDVLTLLFVAATFIWARTSGRRLRAPYALGVALMLVGGAASGLAGPLPSTALLSSGIDILLFWWCFSLVNVFGRADTLRWALGAWCWAGIGWAMVVAVAHTAHITALEGLNAADGNRVLFTFGDPNYAAAYWVTTIFVVYATRKPGARWLRLIGYAFLLWALVLTESNGGVLELGAGIAAILVIKTYRRRGWVGAMAVALTIAIGVGGFFTALPLSSIRQYAASSGQPLLVNSLGRSDQSSAERGQLIGEGMSLYFSSDGVLGLGPATTKPLLTVRQYPYAKEAHDDYLAALIEKGPLGVVGILVLFGSISLRAAAVTRRPLSADLAAVVPHPVGLVGAAVALSVAATYYEMLHFRFAWAIFAFIAILARADRE